MEKWLEEIEDMGACSKAIEWCITGKFKTLDEAWLACERGDYMLWLAGKLSGKPGSDARKRLVLAGNQCARLALPYVRRNDTKPLRILKAAEAWAKGKAGRTLPWGRVFDANSACLAAIAVYNIGFAVLGGYPDVASSAFDVASYGADAIATAHFNGRRYEVLKQYADIVRQFYPKAPKEEE